MTRFQPQGSRITYNMSETSDSDRETPFKQIIGLYGMWNSLGPETKLRIKKALGIQLNAEDEWALRKLDKQRAWLEDYMNNGTSAERYNKAVDKITAEQQAIQDPIRDQLAEAQQLALSTPYQWTTKDPIEYSTDTEPVQETANWQGLLRQQGRTPRRDPDLSRPDRYQEGMPRPSISWEDFTDDWEYR